MRPRRRRSQIQRFVVAGLVALFAASPVLAMDVDNNGRPDLLAQGFDGSLSLYSGDGRGGFSIAGRDAGSGWEVFDRLISPGDWSGDGKADLLGRFTARADLFGTLWVEFGDGRGRFTPEPPSGQISWQGGGWEIFDKLVAPGDWNGDGRVDIIARKPNGSLWWYGGDGRNGFSVVGEPLGAGWNIFNEIVGPGDWNGDGRADLLARRYDGTLWLYGGNGRGGFAVAGVPVDDGWSVFKTILAPGDWDGDAKPDLLGIDFTGSLWLYPGDGRGGFLTGGRFVDRGGWENFRTIVTGPDATPRVPT
jgi:FG-GAP-like repeat